MGSGPNVSKVTVEGGFDEDACAALALQLVNCSTATTHSSATTTSTATNNTTVSTSSSATVNATAGGSSRGAPCTAAVHAVGVQAGQEASGFVALTGFFVAWRFFGALHPAPHTPAALYAVARAFCGRTWADVQRTHGQHVNVEKYCLVGGAGCMLEACTACRGYWQMSCMLGSLPIAYNALEKVQSKLHSSARDGKNHAPFVSFASVDS